MSPERRQYKISIEEIVSNAKEIMLRDRKHVPILIVEGGKSLVAGQIPDMPPTHGERAELLRFLGYEAKFTDPPRTRQNTIPVVLAFICKI